MITMPLTKAFDRINSVADMAFLAKCSCAGDSCSCVDFNPAFPSISTKKDSSMNILDKLRAAGLTLDAIAQAAPSLPAADRKVLIAALTTAAVQSGRMSDMQATIEHRKERKIEFVSAELVRLGLDKPTAGKKYKLYDIDKAMKAAAWHTDRKMSFKFDLDTLNMLDC